MRFLDIYQVTQALHTVLTNPKQLLEMRKSWQKIDFESVRNQSALVCNCRHEDLVQLLETEFVAVLDGLSKSADPVRDVMAWADKCCERLMGGRSSLEDRTTMSSRSVLIRWGYVTSQVMRDLVSTVDILPLNVILICLQTIRSDPAFGAFQILKLFLEYVQQCCVVLSCADAPLQRLDCTQCTAQCRVVYELGRCLGRARHAAAVLCALTHGRTGELPEYHHRRPTASAHGAYSYDVQHAGCFAARQLWCWLAGPFDNSFRR